MTIILIVLFCLWRSVCSFFCFKLLLFCFVSCPFSTSHHQDWRENTSKCKSPPVRNIIPANCMISVRIGGRWRIIYFLYCGDENLKIQPGPWGTEGVPKPESREVSILTVYSPVVLFHTTYPNKASPIKPTKQNKLE